MNNRLLAYFAKAAPSPETDADLLRRFVTTRDEVAFAELVRRHTRLVWGVCCAVTRNQHYAEDAFQETFVALAKSARKIRSSDAVCAWLRRVATNQSKRVNRTAVRREAREAKATEGRTGITSDENPAVLADFCQALREALAGLPPECREAITLHYLEERSHNETAEQMGLSVDRVRRLIKEGTSLLRDKLGLPLGAIALLLSLLAPQSGVAAAPPLVQTTVQAALGSLSAAPRATGLAGASALWRAATQATTLQVAFGAVLALAVCGVGLASILHDRETPDSQAQTAPATPQPVLHPEGKRGGAAPATEQVLERAPLPHRVDEPRVVILSPVDGQAVSRDQEFEVRAAVKNAHSGSQIVACIERDRGLWPKSNYLLPGAETASEWTASIAETGAEPGVELRVTLLLVGREGLPVLDSWFDSNKVSPDGYPPLKLSDIPSARRLGSVTVKLTQ